MPGPAPDTNQVRGRSRLDLAVNVALICSSAAFVWLVVRPPVSIDLRTGPPPPTVRPRTPLPSSPVEFDRGPRFGAPAARIGVIVYSDYECPSCRRMATESLPSIFTEYVETGRVRVAFRNMPLEKIHKNAWAAAVASECAWQHGRFRQVHDALFGAPGRLDGDAIQTQVLASGVTADQYRACRDGAAERRVQEDVREAASLGATGTPTILFGRFTPEGRLGVVRIEKGAIPFEMMSRMIDRLLEGAQ